MSFIINRIEKSFNLSIHHTDPTNDSKDSLYTFINAMHPDDRANLMKNHAQLNIEYTVLCSKIAQEFHLNQPDEFKEQMKTALKLAELLEIIYSSYLNIPREYERLQQEEIIFKSWLNREARISSQSSLDSRAYVSKAIREKTSNYNFHRFLLVRVRRLLLAIAAVTDPFSSYRNILTEGDRFVGPFFANIAWLYFIPRLSNNLFMTLKHTISNSSMSEQEKMLKWQTRFYIQLKARWPEVSNDLPWFMANSLSYFVLTGAFAPYGILLSISMQLYDVLQTSIQYYVKIVQQLRPQLNTYRQLLEATTPNSLEHQQLQSYIDHFEQYIKYETNRLIVSLINVSVLLIAIILAAPFFAFSPAFAITGGALAVAITITSFIAQKKLPKQQNNLPNLLLNDLTQTPPILTFATLTPDQLNQPTPTTSLPTNSISNTNGLYSRTGFFKKTRSEEEIQRPNPIIISEKSPSDIKANESNSSNDLSLSPSYASPYLCP